MAATFDATLLWAWQRRLGNHSAEIGEFTLGGISVTTLRALILDHLPGVFQGR